MTALATTYLRVVATTRCNLQCAYCHAEGDPPGGVTHALPFEVLVRILLTAVAAGVRKLKFLGGEPLLRADLPDVVRAVRAVAPDLDVSVITAGVVPVERLDALVDAGLSRVNMSIHGFFPDALARRIPTPRAHVIRERFLARVLEHGRPLKLNYVWGSRLDDADLAGLLRWAEGRPLVVNVLDDLRRDLGPDAIRAVLRRLRGEPDRIETVPDADSLETEHWVWDGRLRVEVKHQRLGDHAPFAACATCPKRPTCKEGIRALRLMHDGRLQPCMDRPDLAIDLLAPAANDDTHTLDDAFRVVGEVA